MPKQFFKNFQPRTIVQHMCGEAMTQCMWADIGVQTGDLEVLVHFATNATCAESSSVFIDEQDSNVKVLIVLRPFVPEFHVVLNLNLH